MSDQSYEFVYKDYPLIPIRLCYGDKKTPVIAALIDSGGDSVVIPKAIAQYLGSQIEKTEDAKTAGGTTGLFKTKLDLIIGKKCKKATYKNIDVFVVNNDDIPVLLGRYPLFDDYEITFQKKRGKLILRKV